MRRSTLWVARAGIGTALLLLLLGSFLLFQYRTAVSLADVYPEERAVLQEGRVTIHAAIPGLDPEGGDVRVLLDGKEVPAAHLEFLPAGGVRISRELPDGPHEVSLEVRTRNLFARHLARSWTFTVDTKPPTITSVNPVPDAVLPGGAVVFSAAFEEPAQAELAVDGEQVLEGEGVALSGRMDMTEGRHELVLTARDPAGNETQRSWEVFVDATAPVFSLDVPPEGTWTNGRGHIHLEASDLHSASLKVTALADGQELIVSGGEVVHDAGGAGETSWSYEIETGSLGEGEHVFALVVEDEAGNRAEYESSFAIDVRKIRIDLSERRLYHYATGSGVKEYPVAVGLPQYPTPRGTFEIVIKEKDPTWNPPPSPWAEGLEPVPPGPNNPLGTRWIGLSAYAIGIHGTYERWSIGQAASHGCIRMYIEDVEELFEQIEVGMPVEIVR